MNKRRMTIISLRLDDLIRNDYIFFDPPLPPAKGIRIISLCEDGKKLGIRVFCNIVDPLASYSAFAKFGFGPSQLLGISYFSKRQIFPKVETLKSIDPIREMKISFGGTMGPLHICNYFGELLVLKIYH